MDKKYYELEPLDMPVGEEIKVFDDNDGEEYYVDSISVQAYTDKLPFGVSTQWFREINIIVSENSYKEIVSNLIKSDLNESYHSTESTLYVKSNDPIKTETEIEDISEVAISLMNYYDMQKQEEQLILLLSIFVYGFITLITLISIANIFNTISTSISLRKREFAMLKSMGMTPKGFNKMINYESIFYGFQALLYGLPISIFLMYLMHRTLGESFQLKFTLPWGNLLFVTVAILIIVGSAMLYSISKVKKENIIDVLKQENI